MNLDSVELVAGWARLRWVDADGGHTRQARKPGDSLDDLPAAVRADIEAYWSPQVVAAYEATIVPPEPVEPFLPLAPDQFWGVLRATGWEAEVRAWVDAIEDPVERGFVSAKLEFATFFERDYPLIEDARQALGMSGAELDALWVMAQA